MNRVCAAVVGLTLFAAACGDPTAPPTPTPVPPTFTEVFTGTLSVGGNNAYPFTVQQVGGLTVTINSIVPSAAIGVGIGTMGSSGCSTVDHVNGVAGASVQLSGTVTVTGAVCAAVYDIGNLVEPVVFTITVLHS